MESGMHPIAGGACALGSAAAWALASLIWARLGRRASPLALNLGKGLISLGLLAVVLAWRGFGVLPASGWGILAVSGLIGIGLGDSVYFAALVRLGPRKMLVVTTLIPVAASVLAMVFLGERQGPRWIAGTVLCLAGVTWVLWDRTPAEDSKTPRERRGALLLAFATVACEGLGIFLAKLGMGQGGTAGPLEATFVRLLAGAIGVAGVGLFRHEIGTWFRGWLEPGFLATLTAASLLGSVVGIGLSMAALWLTDVSLASILNATTPLFVLPLSVFVLRERLSAGAVLGALAAVTGVVLLMLPA